MRRSCEQKKSQKGYAPEKKTVVKVIITA